MASALEAALDELFQVAPEQFVETRKALAAKLGKGADAKAVLEQKKPTRVAYLLNRLARQYPDEIDALAKIGERLAAAHHTGKADALREVIAEQRQAVNALSTQASGLMAELGVAPSELPAVNAVLYAATASAERAAELKQGRFSKAPEANVSFFGGASIAVAEPSKPAAVKADPEPKNENVEVAGPTEAELEAEKKRVQAEERARAAAEKAEAEATRAREAAEAIEAELEALEAVAHEAAAALATAKLKVERTTERLEKAQAEAKQRAKEAAALRAVL